MLYSAEKKYINVLYTENKSDEKRILTVFPEMNFLFQQITGIGHPFSSSFQFH